MRMRMKTNIIEAHSTVKPVMKTSESIKHRLTPETTTKSTKSIEHHSSNIYENQRDIIKSHSE